MGKKEWQNAASVGAKKVAVLLQNKAKKPVRKGW